MKYAFLGLLIVGLRCFFGFVAEQNRDLRDAFQGYIESWTSSNAATNSARRWIR